jgi:hypothetical protein
MHAGMVMKLATEFWLEVVHPSMQTVRWDVFEENFSIFLLETLQPYNELFNRLVWKEFFAQLYKKVACTEP